jgi:hypothetical protein
MGAAMPPFPQYVFMAGCLLKRRDNFTFTFNSFIISDVELTEFPLYGHTDTTAM